jgi:Polyketide cyclase / dehydrase and lipid transport
MLFRMILPHPFVLSLFVLGLLLSAPPVRAASPVQSLEVQRQGEGYVIDASFVAPVPRALAWSVLTDFGAMARFVPNLQDSRVTAGSGPQFTVRQQGVARFGPFEFPFDSTRRIDLLPSEAIRSVQIAGNLRRLESHTTLAEAPGGTRVSYHVELLPGSDFPALIGAAFLRHEVREQLEAIVQEMLRRQAAPAARP